MGISALVVAGAAAGASAYQSRKARKSAEEEARLERERIESLQREITAEEKAQPMPDDDAARRARRRSIAGIARRRGRSSTILTGESATSDALGG